MPSMDVVSVVDMQTLDNAINNVKREIATRFDFRGVKTEITLDRKAKSIQITSGDDWKVKEVSRMLAGQCTRLKADSKCLEFKEVVNSSYDSAKMDVVIKDGISKEMGQKVVKFIKDQKMKVQPAILDNKVRVTGTKIDDLQEIIRLLNEQNYDIPLQFINMKR